MARPDPRDRIIEEQRTLIEKLEARIAVLEEKLGKTSVNSSKPPSSDPPWEKPKPKPKRGKKRKKGGQPGHAKHERPLVPEENVGKFVAVKPNQCDGCGGRLLGNDPAPDRHQVFDVPAIEPTVTEYQLHSLRCGCGITTKGRLPDGVPHGAFGSHLVALVCWLTGKFRLSKRGVQELLSDLLNTEVSLGAVSKMEREASAALETPFEEAQAYVREQDVAHADETGWRELNQKAWLWVVVTSQVTIFKIALSRGAAVIKNLLGVDFAGILVTDRWSAYTFVTTACRQLCWAHLLRDFQSFVDRGGESQRIGESLQACAWKMFKWWHKVRDGTMSHDAFQKKMLPVALEVVELLAQGTGCLNTRTAGTCAHILALEEALWTFVHDIAVHPTNNLAERIIRQAVLWRKTSFGTQSEAGSRFVERILTATATLKLQNRNVLSYLTDAIDAHRRGVSAPSLLPNHVELNAQAA